MQLGTFYKSFVQSIGRCNQRSVGAQLGSTRQHEGKDYFHITVVECTTETVCPGVWSLGCEEPPGEGEGVQGGGFEAAGKGSQRLLVAGGGYPPLERGAS